MNGIVELTWIERNVRLIRWLLLAIHATLIIQSNLVHSPALDEVAHLAAGVHWWHTGSNRLYCVNPPLIKALAAGPVVARKPSVDEHRLVLLPGERSEFLVGRDFLRANPERFPVFFRDARMILLPLSLAGGLICYRWAAQLGGAESGLMSLSLWCLSPDVLTNAAMITPDLGCSTLGLLAMERFRHCLQTDAPRHWLATGVLLGIAVLTKFTCLIFFPLTLFLSILYPISRERNRCTIPKFIRRRVGRWALLLMSSLLTINSGYGWQKVGHPLGKFSFFSRTLSGNRLDRQPQEPGNRFLGTWLGSVPVPLPEDVLTGIDLQKRDFEQGLTGYLGGENKLGGWWYFYLATVALKTPLSWLILALTLACLAFQTQLPRTECLLLLAPAFTLLFVVSQQTGINRYPRYLLPMWPFLFIWMGAACRNLRGHRRFRWLAWPLLLSGCFPVVHASPHHHSYFNQLAGGSHRGNFWLIDSAVDWGQDLDLLLRWSRTNVDQHLQAVALHTLVPLELFGFQSLDSINQKVSSSTQKGDEPTAFDHQSFPPGWYAFSVHRLRSEPERFSQLLNREPDRVIGATIHLFQLPFQEKSECHSMQKHPVPIVQDSP